MMQTNLNRKLKILIATTVLAVIAQVFAVGDQILPVFAGAFLVNFCVTSRSNAVDYASSATLATLFACTTMLSVNDFAEFVNTGSLWALAFLVFTLVVIYSLVVVDDDFDASLEVFVKYRYVVGAFAFFFAVATLYGSVDRFLTNAGVLAFSVAVNLALVVNHK